jgi:hypothetical protein
MITIPTFYQPVRFAADGQRGFIVRPHRDDGIGWGDPRRDEAGNLITPGTPGGPNDRAVLSPKKGSWTSERRDNAQGVGNIDWKGQWASDRQAKREVVTFHGPTQRYWNDGSFTYGSNVNHRFIYQNGVVIGIAPYPVLGAALAQFEDKKIIIAICKESNYESVYFTLQKLSLVEDNITPEIIAAYDAGSSETTWNLIGSTFSYADGFNAVPAEAPWFFSTDGLSARTMRRCLITHNNLDGLTDFEDQVYREMRLSIDPVTLTPFFSFPDGPGFVQETQTWRTTVTAERTPTTVYTQPWFESASGVDHYFEEAQARGEREMVGKSKVAVDYHPDDNVWIYGWIEGGYLQTVTQNFTVNVDQQYEPDREENRTGSEEGPLPFPDPKPNFSPRYVTQKLGIYSNMTLKIGTSAIAADGKYGSLDLSYGTSQSGSQFLGDTDPATSDLLVFVQTVNSFLQFCDLRSGLVVARSQGAAGQTLTSPGVWDLENVDIQWSGVIDAEGSDDFVTDTDNVTYFYYVNASTPLKGNVFPPWSYIENKAAAGVEENDDYFSYSGIVSMFNSDGSEFQVSWADFWQTWLQLSEFPWWTPTTVTQILRDNRSAMSGVIGSTEKNEHLMALEYIDPLSGEYVSKAKSINVDGDPIAAVKGGTRITPGGLL